MPRRGCGYGVMWIHCINLMGELSVGGRGGEMFKLTILIVYGSMDFPSLHITLSESFF